MALVMNIDYCIRIGPYLVIGSVAEDRTYIVQLVPHLQSEIPYTVPHEVIERLQRMMVMS